MACVIGCCWQNCHIEHIRLIHSSHGLHRFDTRPIPDSISICEVCTHWFKKIKYSSVLGSFKSCTICMVPAPALSASGVNVPVHLKCLLGGCTPTPVNQWSSVLQRKQSYIDYIIWGEINIAHDINFVHHLWPKHGNTQIDPASSVAEYVHHMLTPRECVEKKLMNPPQTVEHSVLSIVCIHMLTRKVHGSCWITM